MLPMILNLICKGYLASAQHQVKINLGTITPSKTMGIPNHNRHFTPSSIALDSASRDYSSSPIKNRVVLMILSHPLCLAPQLPQHHLMHTLHLPWHTHWVILTILFNY